MVKIIAPHIGFEVLIFKEAGAAGMLLFIRQHLISFWSATPLSSDTDLNDMGWTFDHNRANQNQLGFCFNHQEEGPPSLLRHIGLMTIWAEMLLKIFAWKQVQHREEQSQKRNSEVVFPWNWLPGVSCLCVLIASMVLTVWHLEYKQQQHQWSC